jgi:hypothetical protein
MEKGRHHLGERRGDGEATALRRRVTSLSRGAEIQYATVCYESRGMGKLWQGEWGNGEAETEMYNRK